MISFEQFLALTAPILASEKNEAYSCYRWEYQYDPISCFKTPSCVFEKGTFFMCGLLTINVPTFVQSLEPTKVSISAESKNESKPHFWIHLF